jgi:hypothetical protein
MAREVSYPDEQLELEHVKRRLTASFSGRVPEDEIGRTVDEIAAEFRGAPIRRFVPLLTERYATGRLAQWAQPPSDALIAA